VHLQQGHLAAHFDQDILYIDTLNFTSPHEQPPRDHLLAGLNLAPEAGSISATGAVDLAGKNGDLQITASHLPLTQRKDRWIIASGSGRANLDKNKIILNGSITADAGLISQPVAGRPQLSDDVLFTGQQSLVRNEQFIVVDAVLDLGKQFYLRASGLEARLAGQLHLRGEPGHSQRVTGTIEANEASYEAYGQHLIVERGIVNFQGPLEDPGVNILALRKNLPVEAGVEVIGTVRRPVVKLVSTPNVPDSEKLSWIVLGHAPDDGGSDAPTLIAAAESIFGGQSGGITSQLTHALGVDEFSIRQAGNSSRNVYGTPLTPQNVNGAPLSNQIVTIGKRLSARASISYEQGVSAAAGVTKLTYTLTPRISIVTQAGADNAIDVFYTFSFK
jgi:translocation and assembly module TamB